MIDNLPSVKRRASRLQFTPCPKGPRPCSFVCTRVVPSRVLWEGLLLSSLMVFLYAVGSNGINCHLVFGFHKSYSDLEFVPFQNVSNFSSSGPLSIKPSEYCG